MHSGETPAMSRSCGHSAVPSTLGKKYNTQWQLASFCSGKAETAPYPLNLPTCRNIFFVLVLNVEDVYWGTPKSIASLHRLRYQFTGTLQQRECRKICVINCRSKSRQMLFLETAVWEDTKVDILTVALPTPAILW